MSKGVWSWLPPSDSPDSSFRGSLLRHMDDFRHAVTPSYAKSLVNRIALEHRVLSEYCGHGRRGGAIFANAHMLASQYKVGVNLIFRAFSDRTRLRILSLLKQGELCVGDLVVILKAPQPKVSRHLAYLRKAGLVQTREAGLWNFYRLAPAATPFHRKMIECLGACFGDVPEIARDADKAQNLKSTGGCCPDKGSCGS